MSQRARFFGAVALQKCRKIRSTTMLRCWELLTPALSSPDPLGRAEFSAMRQHSASLSALIWGRLPAPSESKTTKYPLSCMGQKWGTISNPLKIDNLSIENYRAIPISQHTVATSSAGLRRLPVKPMRPMMPVVENHNAYIHIRPCYPCYNWSQVTVSFKDLRLCWDVCQWPEFNTQNWNKYYNNVKKCCWSSN